MTMKDIDPAPERLWPLFIALGLIILVYLAKDLSL